MKRANLQKSIQKFRQLREIEELSSNDNRRIREQPRLVSSYYDVVTSFYEFGWGSTFHFAPRRAGESLSESLKRHNEGIGKLLRLVPGMEVADIGCGVGGPLVSIGRATGANIVGINVNLQQIRRGRELVRRAGLTSTCSFLYSDFMDVPLEDGTFDALYSIEAICHAPDKHKALQEVFRLMKPGSEAALIDWSLTDAFDSSNRCHSEVRDQIERNNATPELMNIGNYVEAVRLVGFEVIESKDQQATEGDPATPWYMALQGRDFSLSSFARSPIGRNFVAATTRILERLKLAPTSTSEASRLLNAAADA